MEYYRVFENSFLINLKTWKDNHDIFSLMAGHEGICGVKI